MKHYIFFKADEEDKTEYFVKTLNTKEYAKFLTKLSEIVYGMHNDSIINYVDCNKITIQYPIFNYTKAEISNYSSKVINSVKWWLSLSGDELDMNSSFSKFSCINDSINNTQMDKLQKFLDRITNNKIPKMISNNLNVNFTFKTFEENILLESEAYDIYQIKKCLTPEIILSKTYKQILILCFKKEYIPIIIEADGKIKTICEDYFNDCNLLCNLLSEIYKINKLDIQCINYLDTDVLDINNVALVNIANGQRPKYTYYPISDNGEIITGYGSIDNEEFVSKSFAILYASKFKSVKIVDKSVIPYIKNGDSFEVKEVDFGILSQIQHIDSMYENLEYKENHITAINKHGKNIGKSIDNIAVSNNKIANNIKIGMKYMGDTIDNAGKNIAESNIVTAEIGRGLHMLS